MQANLAPPVFIFVDGSLRRGSGLAMSRWLSHIMRTTVDANGNVLTETRQCTVNGTLVDETVTHTEYCVAGFESARLDAMGHRTEMDHDAYGRLTQTRYPNGTTENTTYDSEGNKLTSTDRLGRTTTYQYDALNPAHPNHVSEWHVHADGI